MAKSFNLTNNAKDLHRSRSLVSVVSGFERPDTVNESILTLTNLSKQTIQSLFIAARYAVEYARFDFACLSPKNILRKVIINNTESLKTAIRNKTGAVRGYMVRPPAGNQEIKADLTRFVLLNS